MAELKYAPSPTQLAFHNDTTFLRGIAGPPGGGKSVACLMEGFFRCMRQPPNKEGMRQYRLCVVRDTYPALHTTVKKTIQEWLPEEIGTLKGNMPIEGTFRLPLPDGTTMHLEIVMLSVDENTLTKLQSLEISGAWVNEAATIPKAVIDMLIQRVGRYPAVKNGVACAEPGVWIDFNLPGEDHWIYKTLVLGPREFKIGIETPDGLEELKITNSLHLQPAAVLVDNLKEVDAGKEAPIYRLNPAAENLGNLPKTYYAQQLIANPSREEWYRIRAFLGMMWTTMTLGRLVYGDDFVATEHVAREEIPPVSGANTIVGVDTSGLHPCAIFVQLRNGIAAVTDELYGDGVGFELFITDMLQPMVATRYVGCPMLFVCDVADSRDARTGVTPTQLLNAHNFRAITAPTNKPKLRKQAVTSLLARRHGLLISSNCKMLIDGFIRSYVHKEIKSASGGAAIFSPNPDKTQPASHYHDALQYAALHIVGGAKDARIEIPDTWKQKLKPRPFA